MNGGDKKKDVNCFYYYIYKSLITKIGKVDEIDITEAESYLGQAYRVPLTLRIAVLKEMEQAGFILFLNKYRIRILKKDVPELDNKSKIYRKVGLW